MEKYVISFGCMCSTAIFLKEKGYRDRSSFFDWVDSNLVDNIKLINNNFEDILNDTFLEQKYTEHPHIITNTRYNISFAHVFNPKQSFASQKKRVEKKCFRMIDNFMNALYSNKALLVYYLRSKSDYENIAKNEALILSFLKQFNAELVIISNFPCDFSFARAFIIPANNIHKPFGGEVSFPFEKTEDIEMFLDTCVSDERKKKNLSYYSQHKRRSFCTRLNSFFDRFRSNKLKI